MEKDIYLLISKNIKHYRKLKKLSIEDLSIITNIDVNFLIDLEKNGISGNTTFEQLDKICNGLEVNIIDVLKK